MGCELCWVHVMWVTVLLSAFTFRLTRFLILDSLIAVPRVWVHTLILGKNPKGWRDKLHELVTCSYCISWWIALGAVWVADLVGSVMLPGFQVWAVAAGSVLLWRIVED